MPAASKPSRRPASAKSQRTAPLAPARHAPLIIDIAGTQLTAVDRRRLAHPLTGGIILFARNCESRAQLCKLTTAIKAVRKDLLICIDHEGGRVQRFKSDGFTHLPPMAALGKLWMDDGQGRYHRQGSGAMRAMAAASASGYVLASELRACGIDFSFTPVLDLDWGDSTVIGDRAFHADARVVSMLARALMQGLLQAGMANCGKHFPGHGFVAADSHTEVPVDTRSLEAILADDAAPYPWLSGVLSSVMPAHVIYPAVDQRPAGFSSTWLQEILRQRLGFNGAIFSDDLSMEGARRLDGALVSYGQAAIAALQAGCDLVLLCNQSLPQKGSAIDTLLTDLTAAQENGQWQPNATSEARRLVLLPVTPALHWDALQQSPAYHHALELLP